MGQNYIWSHLVLVYVRVVRDPHCCRRICHSSVSFILPRCLQNCIVVSRVACSFHTLLGRVMHLGNVCHHNIHPAKYFPFSTAICNTSADQPLDTCISDVCVLLLLCIWLGSPFSVLLKVLNWYAMLKRIDFQNSAD